MVGAGRVHDEAELDPRVGGAYRIGMHNHRASSSTSRASSSRSTHHDGSSTPSAGDPDPDDQETTVTLSLAAGDATMVSLRQGFATEARLDCTGAAGPTVSATAPSSSSQARRDGSIRLVGLPRPLSALDAFRIHFVDRLCREVALPATREPRRPSSVRARCSRRTLLVEEQVAQRLLRPTVPGAAEGLPQDPAVQLGEAPEAWRPARRRLRPAGLSSPGGGDTSRNSSTR